MKAVHLWLNLLSLLMHYHRPGSSLQGFYNCRLTNLYNLMSDPVASHAETYLTVLDQEGNTDARFIPTFAIKV